jgi:hypothetical protein
MEKPGAYAPGFFVEVIATVYEARKKSPGGLLRGSFLLGF